MSTEQTATAPARIMIQINGKSIEALTPERVDAMIAGMSSKGKELKAHQAGARIKGIKVIGEGQPFEGPLGTRYIYNVDLLSSIAFDGPKAVAAFEALCDAAADGDATEVHNACRAYLNSVTVSFNVPTRRFRNGELIEASVELVTTKNGSLITLNNVVVMAAEALKAEPAKKFSLAAMLGKRQAELTAAAPTEPVQPTAEVINAAATA